MFTRLIEKSGAAPASLDLSESQDQIEEEGAGRTAKGAWLSPLSGIPEFFFVICPLRIQVSSGT
jgi:hypothetical protein